MCLVSATQFAFSVLFDFKENQKIKLKFTFFSQPQVSRNCTPFDIPSNEYHLKDRLLNHTVQCSVEPKSTVKIGREILVSGTIQYFKDYIEEIEVFALAESA